MRIPLFLIGLIAVPVFAQSEVTLAPTALHRVDESITLDGRLDEPVWREVSSLPVVMCEPTFQGEPTERTEIRIAYGENHLYVAGAFYDSEPDAIRANSLHRDQSNESSPWRCR